MSEVGGELLTAVLANPAVRGVLFQSPYALKTPSCTWSAGVAARCDYVAGDFFGQSRTEPTYVLKA